MASIVEKLAVGGGRFLFDSLGMARIGQVLGSPFQRSTAPKNGRPAAIVGPRRLVSTAPRVTSSEALPSYNLPDFAKPQWRAEGLGSRAAGSSDAFQTNNPPREVELWLYQDYPTQASWFVACVRGSLMDAVDEFCSSNSSQGFERLLGNHGDFLLAWLSKLFDGTSLDLDDVAQRSWYKAWRTREAFCARSPRLFKAWLFRIARNEALQDLRKTKASDLPEDFDPVDDTLADPADTLSELEQRLPVSDSLSLTLGDPALKACMEKLKLANEGWFEALVSKILDEDGEEAVLQKYRIDRPTLSRYRWNAKQSIQQCMKGAAS